jgi:putative DNA-binding protein
MNASTVEREALRQRLLLGALWRDTPPDALQGWLRQPPGAAAPPGLAAYRANAGAIAERALAGAFPTVAALVGAESFAALARDCWQQHPPVRGDLGEWGAALPDVITAQAALASEPYLADSARLDWLVHLAARAADGPEAPPALEALAHDPPEALRLVLRPGCALLASAWPVGTIWHAHQPAQEPGGDRFAAVRAAFAEERSEQVFIRRDGFAVRIDALDEHAAAFSAAVLRGASLAVALDAAGDGFAFDQWLLRAVQQRWLVAIQAFPPFQPSEAP